jgi:hypothetical protein
MEAIVPIAIIGGLFLLFAVPRLLRQKQEFESGTQPIQQALAKREREKVAGERAASLGIDIRVLGLKKSGAGYEVKSWRGDKVVVPLDIILRQPENFRFDEAQKRYVKLWQEANPVPNPTYVYCRACGVDTTKFDHTPECRNQGVLLS